MGPTRRLSERERGVTPEESRFGRSGPRDPEEAEQNRRSEQVDHCSICRPRPDEHEYHGPTGRGGPTFCDNHDEEDWQVCVEHAEEQRREAMMEERAERGLRR